MRLVKSEEIKLRETNIGEQFAVLVGRHTSSGGATQQTVAMVILRPGYSSDPHFHKEREESYFFLEGTGVAEVSGTRVEVKKGDLIFTHSGERHCFENNSETDLKYLVFTSPQWIPEDSFQ